MPKPTPVLGRRIEENWNLGVRLPVSRQFIVDHAVPSGYQGIFVFRQIN